MEGYYSVFNCAQCGIAYRYSSQYFEKRQW